MIQEFKLSSTEYISLLLVLAGLFILIASMPFRTDTENTVKHSKGTIDAE